MAISHHHEPSRGPIRGHRDYIHQALPRKKKITNGYLTIAVPRAYVWAKKKGYITQSL